MTTATRPAIAATNSFECGARRYIERAKLLTRTAHRRRLLGMALTKFVGAFVVDSRRGIGHFRFAATAKQLERKARKSFGNYKSPFQAWSQILPNRSLATNV
jgi:hypothetical protein